MSLAAVPLVWSAHFLALYVLVSLACRTGATAIVVPGVALATLAALGFYAWFGALSYRRWSAAGEVSGFIALTNLLLCAVSAVWTVWVAYPAFMLAPCVR